MNELQANIQKIQEIEQEQKVLAEKIPFKVKYPKDFLWQIYYSENSDRYFMLVSTEEQIYSECFYLIKKKIEFEKRKISHQDNI